MIHHSPHSRELLMSVHYAMRDPAPESLRILTSPLSTVEIIYHTFFIAYYVALMAIEEETASPLQQYEFINSSRAFHREIKS